MKRDAHHNRRIGYRGEELAADRLKAAGYRILARNWRCPAGEIDIVAQAGDELVCVEVRARSNPRFGKSAESITTEKQRTLLSCGSYLVAEWQWQGTWRIDVFAIDFDAYGNIRDIQHIRHAVEA